MNTTKHFKQHWPIITLLVVLAIIVALNLNRGSVIMGLDNASPYFYPAEIFGKIQGSDAFIYSGVLFSMPFLALLRVFFSPSVVSHIYVLGCFTLGVVGTYYVSTSVSYVILKKAPPRKCQIVGLVSAVILLLSLLTLWILSQPNFLFLAAYASIPWLIFLLTFGDRLPRILRLALLGFFSLIFLITSQNTVAFLLYAIQITVISYTLKPDRTSLKKFLLWAGAVIAVWLITLQIVSIINGDSSFVVTNLISYVRDLSANPFMESIKRDIIASEMRNDIFNSARFATGWMELHNTFGLPIFSYYSIYNTLHFAVIGIMPAVIAVVYTLHSVYRGGNIRKRAKQYQLNLLIVAFVGLFLMSVYWISAIKSVPYLSDAFRWSSSKMWPLFIFPMVTLAGVGIVEYTSMIYKRIKTSATVKKSLLISLSVISIIIAISYGFPLFIGTAVSETVTVTVPQDYFDMRQHIEPDSSILYVPPPQDLYFRTYHWGYFGSDFLSYIYPADIIDSANLYEYGESYEDYLAGLYGCELETLTDVDYILYDHSVLPFPSIHSDISRAKSCLVTIGPTYSNGTLTLYEL